VIFNTIEYVPTLFTVKFPDIVLPVLLVNMDSDGYTSTSYSHVGQDVPFGYFMSNSKSIWLLKDTLRSTFPKSMFVGTYVWLKMLLVYVFVVASDISTVLYLNVFKLKVLLDEVPSQYTAYT